MKMKKSLVATLVAFASLAIAAGIYSLRIHPQPKPKPLPQLIFPKGSTYTKEWKKVDSLIKDGLSKSAIEQVEMIYNKAKSDNNAPQIVKAIMYRLRLVQQYQEDDIYNSIYKMNNEIKTSSYPLTPMLHTMLADIYQQYYQRYRWKFSQRTEVVNVKLDDISTWDLKTLFDQIIKHHLLALKSADSLKRTPLNIYDDILEQGTSDVIKLRPTLYDFIAHRAVDFLASEEPDVIRPAYKFELNSENYFANFDDFAKINIPYNGDSLSTKYYAIKILQDLIAFHANDDDPQALIDADLERLKFVKTHATTGINDSLYLNTLLALEQRFIKYPSSTEVSYAIAGLYSEKGNKYDPRKSEDNKWFSKKAVEKCKEAELRFPDSYGAKECITLETTIKQKKLAFDIEKANLIDKPFRGYLSYTNVSKVYARVIPIEFENYRSWNNNYYGDQKKFLKKYLKITPIKQWAINLPDDGDYQTHYTEIKIPELHAGYYLVLISGDSGFSLSNNGIAFSPTWVSNLSFVDRKTPDGGYEFYVLDRETGNPVKGATANLWNSQYNNILRKYEYVISDSKISDEDGHVDFAPKKDYAYFDVELIHGKDKFRTDDNYSLYMYRNSISKPVMEPRTTLFTDRAIYRPGQTIYFKGIMIRTDGKHNEILPNYASTVTFYDVNYQKIASLDLKTNEYGSYSGTFTAPAGMLNGSMTISDNYGTVRVQVEDYKRPKFDVVFSPVSGSYRLNDSVRVSGTAKAYSGANIEGAQVKYRVVRNASFPYWFYYWWGYYPSSPEMEITNGIAMTNDTGGYFINFKAIPDLSIPKSYSPTYNYTVFADVTDINGETHSSETYVEVAYNALNLNVGLPGEVNKEKVDTFPIYTTNTNGVADSAVVKMGIYKLKEPDKIFRKREWEKPDKFIITKEEYSVSFPHDVYNDEDNMYKWERGEKVYENTYNTHKEKEFSIKGISSWKPGTYVMEAHAKDKYGEDVKDIRYFTVYSEKETVMPNNSPDWFTAINDKGEPGEKASYLIGSKEKDVKVLYEIEEQGKSVHREWITLNEEQKKIEVPIEERNRGNFAVHFAFVKNSRMYEHDDVITVPWTNKELDVQFETFRNKLLPGQKEEWKVKIKDKKGDKMMAEMMATLYDASLDAFKINSWNFNVYNNYYSELSWENSIAFGTHTSTLFNEYWNQITYYPSRIYDKLNWFGYYFYYYGYYRGGYGDEGGAVKEEKSMAYNATPAAMPMQAQTTTAATGVEALDQTEVAGKKEDDNYHESNQVADRLVANEKTKNGEDADNRTRNVDLSNISARTNFNETAFFYPRLETDSTGSIIISFTIPEALTKWKMMGLAHTKDLKTGQITKELVTQKELMVVPNSPRFFRENDKIEFTSKVTDLSDKDLTGTAQLLLFDAVTMKPIDPVNIIAQYKNTIDDGTRSFTVKKGLSTNLSWDLYIPAGIGAITYKVVAKADNYSDGEEMAVPVLTNRMLVTESMPLPIRGMQTKTFRFEKFITQNGGSTTLRNHKLTLEFTSNPAWYAVQALPYIMEYPYECAEQTFDRFYANSIASNIANSSPKIKAVFDSWKSQTPDALLSNLEKNQELKSLMLEETPWVMDAKDETERKHRVALLFDLNHMSNELSHALNKLEKMQLSNGGWPWFDGMPDDRYITQYIITGMGHLDHLGIKNVRNDNTVWSMVKKGTSYLDDRIREDYEEILKYGHPELDNLGCEQIQYLYARSYFRDIPISSRDQKAFDYFKGQEQQFWNDNKGRYMEGMIALALSRYSDKVIPGKIIKSLKENSISNEEMGMYWKENYDGFYWWEAPIECQALLIEAFDEVAHDEQSVDDMKVWLLKSKQTQNWHTTKATTEACYALLLRGTDWLSNESDVEITMGNTKIDPKNMPDVKQEAGTGYFKTSWSGSDIKPEMGNVTVAKKDKGVSWGAVYWQYFEQLDKITSSKTPLQLVKKLFVEHNTASGPVLEPIDSNTLLKVGDKIKVRIELRVDRDMQYVQMKDMRASGFEPINVISQYKWQDGLGYYESTRDAATNFFISYLNKGTYVFEYPLRVTHNGNFSNGITSIQCMYAPEFTSNSEGIRVKVGKFTGN
ncbi:MAG: alpha-2-macroglobulin family protein [Bacteroidia bacterium]